MRLRKQTAALFLPYQIKWLKDQSPVKIWEKSRRIGATFVQSYEDVSDVLMGRVPAVWFSSADESAAKEYIQYCGLWVSMFSRAKSASEIILKEHHKGAQMQLQFANGGRITALSSNPKAFRSKGGKVVLDEFAHHEDAEALWKAAKPAVTWGFPLRILSTHNGRQSLFYRFTEKAAKGDLPWSLHVTSIHDAVADGLVSRVMGKEVTDIEIKAWLDELRTSCYNDIVWNEEFCCVPVDEATALLPLSVIAANTGSHCKPFYNQQVYAASRPEAPLYLGVDIGRKHDATVMFGLTPHEGKLQCAVLVRMNNKSFSEQKKELHQLLAMHTVRHCVIDATGMGMALAEEARGLFGKNKVTALQFTAALKEELAYEITTAFDEEKLLLPDDSLLIQDLHSVRRYVTEAGNVAYEAARSSAGHGDMFWALAMAIHAVKNSGSSAAVISGGATKTKTILRGFK